MNWMMACAGLVMVAGCTDPAPQTCDSGLGECGPPSPEPLTCDSGLQPNADGTACEFVCNDGRTVDDPDDCYLPVSFVAFYGRFAWDGKALTTATFDGVPQPNVLQLVLATDEWDRDIIDVDEQQVCFVNYPLDNATVRDVSDSPEDYFGIDWAGQDLDPITTDCGEPGRRLDPTFFGTPEQFLAAVDTVGPHFVVLGEPNDAEQTWIDAQGGAAPEQYVGGDLSIGAVNPLGTLPDAYVARGVVIDETGAAQFDGDTPLRVDNSLITPDSLAPGYYIIAGLNSFLVPTP